MTTCEQRAASPRLCVLAVTLLCALALLATACAPTAEPQVLRSARPRPAGGGRVHRELPAWLWHLPLTDQRGRRVQLADFRGRVVMLADFFTLCREVCPLTSANLALLRRKLARAGLAEQVELLEVTVDPGRDSPRRLRAYSKLFGISDNWRLLTGSAPNLRRLWAYLGVAYRARPLRGMERGTDWWTGRPLTYDVEHTDAVFYIDRHGAERYVTTGLPDVHGATPAPTLTAMLDEQGRRNLTRPGPGAWTVRQALATLRWVAAA